MPFVKGQGGRKPGSKNKLTLARLELRQEALRRLNEDLPEDAFDGDAIALFQRIYKDPNFDPELRLEVAAKIAQFERKDAAPDTEPRYVCIMPPPIPNLEAWKRRYMEDVPNASPEDQAWAERVAKAALKAEENRASPQDKAPWLDDKDGPIQ